MAIVLEVLGGLLLAITLMLSIPVLVLLVETLVAWWPRQPSKLSASRRPSVAVLMPAHNESAGIAAAIASVRSQLQPGDRLLVVADNCSDDTARVATQAGAEVVQRQDAQRRGKGYALDFGVRHLEADPREVVIVVDSDCEVHPGAVDRLSAQCALTGRPTQALYLMHSPPGAGLKTRIAEFAWAVKNHARALGFLRLGVPCQLMGTGMAFPWQLIRTAPLASGHIVEDLQLGLDLARAGSPPLFTPDALVTSTFPSSAEGLLAQRTRWEHGHLSVITAGGLPMLWHGLTRLRPRLVAVALDACVPPLASLVLMILLALTVSGLFYAVTGLAAPVLVASTAFGALMLAVFVAWTRFGRQAVSLKELLTVPGYVLSKLPIYTRLFKGRQVEWVRTKRDEKSK